MTALESMRSELIRRCENEEDKRYPAWETVSQPYPLELSFRTEGEQDHAKIIVCWQYP